MGVRPILYAVLVVAGLALLAVDVFGLVGGVTIQGWSSIAGVACLVVAFWPILRRGWSWVGMHAGLIVWVALALALAVVGLVINSFLWSVGFLALLVLAVRWLVLRLRNQPT
jgi:hypothetical protein